MSQPSIFPFLFLLLCPILHTIASLLHLFCSSNILLHILDQKFDTWSYQRSLSNFTPIPLHMLTCNRAHTLSCLFMYCSSANIGACRRYNILPSHLITNTVRTCCLFLFVIFLLHDIWFVTPGTVAATISLSVSPFRSSLESQRSVPSCRLH